VIIRREAVTGTLEVCASLVDLDRLAEGRGVAGPQPVDRGVGHPDAPRDAGYGGTLG